MNFVEKDNVDLSPECVIAAPLQVRLVESLLENFSIAINSVNISDNVALFEANPLNESQNKVSSIFDEQRTKISSMLTDVANLRVRITDVKNAFIKANPDFESLYTQIELEYSLLFNNLDYSDQSDYIVNIYDLMEKYQMGTIYEEGNKNVADLYNIIDENGNVVMDSGMTFLMIS